MQAKGFKTNEIQEIFSHFDKDKKGYLPTSELGNFLRALNINPSEAEITEIR